MSDFAQRRRMMVDTQVRPSDVTRFPIIDAMLNVPRELFVPDQKREAAYLGEHLELDGGRVLLDPRVFAKMLEAVNPGPKDLVLDLGCGQGYSAAVLARLAQAVVAVEEDEALAGEAEAALVQAGADNVAVTRAPLTEGAPQHGPYDAIILGGAVERLPGALTDQLAEGGRICALFMDGALGVVKIGYKSGGRIDWRDVFNATAPVLPGFTKPREFVF